MFRPDVNVAPEREFLILLGEIFVEIRRHVKLHWKVFNVEVTLVLLFLLVPMPRGLIEQIQVYICTVFSMPALISHCIPKVTKDNKYGVLHAKLGFFWLTAIFIHMEINSYFLCIEV